MTARKFVYKNWEYSINIFEKLSKKKIYAKRFRLEYYILLNDHTTWGKLLKMWIKNLASAVKLFVTLLKYQLFTSKYKDIKKPIVILTTKNNVYLQTLKPVIQYLVQKEANILVLCPSKYYNFMVGYLGHEIKPYIQPFEAVVFESDYLKRVFRLIVSFFIAISDGFWLSFQKVKQKFWVIPAFSRYGMTQYYFGKNISDFFSSGAKLIAANDHWMWESLYFTSARNANADCYVFQHGIIGDFTYPIFAKQFLAWGKYDFDKMQNEYYAKQHEVRIIGSPYFDEVYKKTVSNKTSVSQYNKSYITFLTQPFMS